MALHHPHALFVVFSPGQIGLPFYHLSRRYEIDTVSFLLVLCSHSNCFTHFKTPFYPLTEASLLGNHAQALALAARTHNIPAHIIMPTISTPSKIAATRSHGARITFSGSTQPERAATLRRVIREEEANRSTKLTYIPPYNHPDIILGQGTVGLEISSQAPSLLPIGKRELDAMIAPLGGGGLLSGLATWFSPTETKVFGAEPSYQGGNDAQRGLALEPSERITEVSTLTIADGARTPVGEIPWSIISDRRKVEGVYSVGEAEIKKAMRLVMERMKVVVEPTGVLGLAVGLFDEGFRRWVEGQYGEGGCDLGVVFSGGNTSLEKVAELFGGEGKGEKGERARL